MVALTRPPGGGTPGPHSHPQGDVTGLTGDLATLTAAAAAKLAKASNLADLTSAATARGNLGVRAATEPVTPAEQHGYLAESMDPAGANQSGILTAGVVYVIRLYVPKAGTVSNISLVVATAGATLTAGQNWAALLDDAGNKLAETADLAAVWNSTGPKTHPLVTPQAVAADTFVRVALLSNGTTPPTLRSGSSNANTPSLAQTGAAIRFGSVLTGQTTIPSSLTLSGLTATVPYVAVLT